MAGQRVHGSELASAFASLRANELVWNYVVGNYLKGETPPRVRPALLERRLGEPAGSDVRLLPAQPLSRQQAARAERADDGRRADRPVAHHACRSTCTRRATITSCRGARRTGRPSLVGGDVTFVLGASGHIAGVINPPQPPRRNYWTNDLVTDAPDDWFARAESVPGSWWPHWCAWLAGHGGTQASRRRARPAATRIRRWSPRRAATCGRRRNQTQVRLKADATSMRRICLVGKASALRRSCDQTGLTLADSGRPRESDRWRR